eukprot:EG_transcript_25512
MSAAKPSSGTKKKKRKRAGDATDEQPAAAEDALDLTGLVPPELAALLGVPGTEAAPGKRTRSVAHSDGMWASHIFVPVGGLQQASAQALHLLKAQDALAHAFTPCKDHHVSLSRTLYLQRHEIDPLVARLSAALQDFHRFTVVFDSIALYENEERTTSFVALDVGPGKDQVCRLISAVDHVLKDLNHDVYYQDPRPHCTIGWKSGEKTTLEGIALSPTVSSDVTVIHIKCGKQLYSVKLK